MDWKLQTEFTRLWIHEPMTAITRRVYHTQPHPLICFPFVMFLFRSCSHLKTFCFLNASTKQQSENPRGHFFQVIIHTSVHTYIHTYLHTYRQADRQTDRQTTSSPGHFLKIALAQHCFAGNFYLIWFVNCKTIDINWCNAVNISVMADLSNNTT